MLPEFPEYRLTSTQSLKHAALSVTNVYPLIHNKVIIIQTNDVNSNYIDGKTFKIPKTTIYATLSNAALARVTLSNHINKYLLPNSK